MDGRHILNMSLQLSFETKGSTYPRETRPVYCRGTNQISKRSHRLRTMNTVYHPRHFSISIIFLVLLFSNILNEASAQTNRFAMDSYSLEYPLNWTYKTQPAPDGSLLHMFMGPQVAGAMAYCHATQQPLLPTLSPRASKMNEKQRAEFFSTADQDLLFSLYSNLPSAQGFRLVYSGPVALGKVVPAFSADFFFRVPQGFVYRVRSHYTFWRTAQLSIWCQSVSKSESASDNSFQANLTNFQRLIASIRIKE